MNEQTPTPDKTFSGAPAAQEFIPWRPGETLGEHMERRGVSRREFNKWCLKMIGLMGATALLGNAESAQEAADKIAAMKRPVVIWLQLQECTGCIESTIRSYNEEIGNLVLSVVSVPYLELLMAPSGSFAEKSFHDAAEQPHILVVNGSVPKKEDGAYCVIGGETAETVLRRAAKNATHVLAVGACAFYGSVQAARPNPTGAVGVEDILTDIPVINVPGCPPIGDVITAVLLYILTFNKVPPCDAQMRPLMAYGTRIHNNCQRRGHFDAGQFVNCFDDANARQGFCLYKVGCKGPNTFSPCPIVKWNGGVSFPIQAGHPCIGCTEKNFFDEMTPFYKTLPDIHGFGIETSANAVGVAAMTAAGIGIGAHIVGTAVHYKSQFRKEEANVNLTAYGDSPADSLPAKANDSATDTGE